MSCSICGRAKGAPTPPCPHCPPPTIADVPDTTGVPHAADGPNFALVPTMAAQQEMHSDAPTADPAAPAAPAAPVGPVDPVDPEILPPEEQDTTRGPVGAQNIFGQRMGTTTQAEGQSANGSFRFAMWHGTNAGGGAQGGGMGGMGSLGLGRSSCLPGCITLFLLLTCAVQFGVLAALGFLIFHLVGSGIMLALNVQQIMRGRPAYFWLIPLCGPALAPVVAPWIGRVLVWSASWGLVGWLSNGF